MVTVPSAPLENATVAGTLRIWSAAFGPSRSVSLSTSDTVVAWPSDTSIRSATATGAELATTTVTATLVESPPGSRTVTVKVVGPTGTSTPGATTTRAASTLTQPGASRTSTIASGSSSVARSVTGTSRDVVRARLIVFGCATGS